MTRSCSCLVLAVLIQVIFGQGKEPALTSGPFPPPTDENGNRLIIPSHCLSPPYGIDLHKCCPIPKLFPDEDMDRCGIEKASVDRSSNSPPKPKVPCKESICLMQNANMLLANQSVDYEKLRTFVDNWARIDPDFTVAIYEAKKICARDGGPSEPPVCLQDRIFYCLTSNVIWNCNIRHADVPGDCQTLKAHMDECRPYYWKQRELEVVNLQKSKLM